MAIIKGFIFDLDGVLVDTAKYHFQAWKRLADSIGIKITEKHNEQLKGVSRVNSLKKILEWGNQEVSDEEFQRLTDQKNQWYLDSIEELGESDPLPGVREFLEDAEKSQLKLALASGSKNAKPILDKTNLTHFFQAIVDGTMTSNSKPDPELFLLCAEKMELEPDALVVFEDAQSGIEAANAGGFRSVGIGKKKNLPKAEIVFEGLHETRPAEVINKLNF